MLIGVFALIETNKPKHVDETTAKDCKKIHFWLICVAQKCLMLNSQMLPILRYFDRV